jgi:hypothetical protein
MSEPCIFIGCKARFDPSRVLEPGETGWYWPEDANEDPELAEHDHRVPGMAPQAQNFTIIGKNAAGEITFTQTERAYSATGAMQQILERKNGGW